MSSVTDVAKSLVADIFNRGDMDVFDRLFAEDYVNHNMPVPDVPTALKFPDLWTVVSVFLRAGHGLAACWPRRRDGIRWSLK
jgi:hypothetical protein